MKFGDRVQETTSTTGTGDITLAGPTDGHLSFADEIGENTLTPYLIEDGGEWEHAMGELSGNILTRMTIKSSIGGPLNLSGNDATVSCALPASWFTSPSFTEHDLGDISGAVTIDASNGHRQIGNMTGTVAISLTTPDAPCSIQLRLTGDHAVDWPESDFAWVGGGDAPDFGEGDRLVVLSYGAGGWVADGGKF